MVATFFNEDDLRRLRAYLQNLLQKFPPARVTLPMTVQSDGPRQTRAATPVYQYKGHSIEVFLDSFPFSSLLLGPPGAGKTHALRQAAVRSTYRFLEETDDYFPSLSDIKVPVYVDLKLYNGSLEELLVRSGVPCLPELVRSQAAHFFIDSYNEAGKRFTDSGRLQEDMQAWIARFPDSRWMIASRTAESLDFFEGEQFEVASIERDYVERQLAARHVVLGDRKHDLMKLLERPIFFFGWLNERMTIADGGMHPSAAIESIIESYSRQMRQEFGHDPQLITCLGPIAEQATAAGEEIVDETAVRLALGGDEQSLPIGQQILARLVELGFLLDYGEGRISLYHQSLTEFLSARRVAERLNQDVTVLDQYLVSTRWDETLALATFYLHAGTSEAFFAHVVHRNLELAVRLARLAEHNRDTVIANVLDALVRALQEPTHGLETHWVDRLPAKQVHVPQLYELLNVPGKEGGPAAKLLVNILGTEAIRPIVEAVFAHPDDFNLGSEGGRAIAPLMDASWIKEILSRANQAPVNAAQPETWYAIENLIAHGLDQLGSEAVIREFWALSSNSRVVVDSLVAWAYRSEDGPRGRFLVDLLCQGHSQVRGNYLWREGCKDCRTWARSCCVFSSPYGECHGVFVKLAEAGSGCLACHVAGGVRANGRCGGRCCGPCAARARDPRQ